MLCTTYLFTRWQNYYPLITFMTLKINVKHNNIRFLSVHLSDCHVYMGIFQKSTLQLVHRRNWVTTQSLTCSLRLIRLIST